MRDLKIAMTESINARGIANQIWGADSTNLNSLGYKIDAARSAAVNAIDYFDKTGYASASAIKEDIQAAIDEYDTIKPTLITNVRARVTEGNTTKLVSSSSSMPVKDIGSDAVRGLDTAITKLKNALQRTRQVVKEVVQVEVGGHLYNQLIMPETIFLSPPRCNVLFPDQYFSLQYSRNFLREPTRLALQVGLGILAGSRGSNLLDRFYYAPSTQDVYGKLLYTTMSAGSRVLLPHEVHCGIIPRFEWVTDGHRWGVKAAENAGSTNPMYASGKIGYLQRLANLQFFLHRWQSRALSISGVFNPRVVLGLPMVIMDKALPPSVIVAMTEKLGSDYYPTQFIGKLVSLNHSISQEGGTTQYGLSYVRTHRGLDDEFLGVLVSEMAKINKAKVKFVTEKVINIPESYPVEHGAFIKIINLYVAGFKTLDGQFLKFYNSVVTDTVLGPLVPFTYDAAKSAGVDIHKVAVGGTINLPSSFEFKINKEVGEAEFIRGALAPEDALMPAWYDDVWRKKDQTASTPQTKNISDDVYMPLLGTRAITDSVPMNQAAQQQALLKQANETTRETSKPTAQVNQIPGGIKVVVPTGSIEEAIDGLALVYGLLKEKNADVHEFINDYTYREIATMKQVLGDRHLTFDDNGRVTDPTKMTEGFHSRAFGDYNTDVETSQQTNTGTLQAPQEPTPGTEAMHLLYVGVNSAQAASISRPLLVNRKNSAPTSIKAYLDPRGRASARVQAYLKELRASRGLFGV